LLIICSVILSVYHYKYIWLSPWETNGFPNLSLQGILGASPRGIFPFNHLFDMRWKTMNNNIEIIKCKKEEGYEKDFSWFWFLYRYTVGKWLGDRVERKTWKIIEENLSEEQRKGLADPQKRGKILEKFRRSKTIQDIFRVRTFAFNYHSPLMQHFCEQIASVGALDDVYNANGSFCLNGKVTWPKSASADNWSWFHLNCPNGQAVRNRYRLVVSLYQEIGGGDTLSIACGSAQPLIHATKLLKERGKGADAKLLLSDIDQKALDMARFRAEEAGIANQVEYLKESFFKLKKRLAGKKFKVVELCGILDYLKDRLALSLFEIAFDFLNSSNGYVIASNMSQTSEADLLKGMYNWEIDYRSPQEFITLIKKAGGENIKLYIEPWGIHPVALISI
ncbi:MAG: hypothetical protein V1891_05415, partial [bacterium]